MCVKGEVKSVVSFDSVFMAEDKGYENAAHLCSLSAGVALSKPASSLRGIASSPAVLLPGCIACSPDGIWLSTPCAAVFLCGFVVMSDSTMHLMSACLQEEETGALKAD